MEKTIYLIRHGETDLNKKGIVQGRGMDTDLNDYGRKQANAFFNAYQHIPFDKIYTSTLKRTHQTVRQFIDKGISWTQYSGLDELAWGIHEGQVSTDERKSAFNHLMTQWNSGSLDEKFEGGESPLEVKERQLEVLETLIKENEAKNILICMHGRAMRVFLCLLTGREICKMEDFPHQNTTLYKLRYDGEKFTIVDFHNLDHLKYLRDEN